MEKSHWNQAQEVAKKYVPMHSVVYAHDHLEALNDQRLVVKPKDMEKEEWEDYKQKTANLQKALSVVSDLVI